MNITRLAASTALAVMTAGVAPAAWTGNAPGEDSPRIQIESALRELEQAFGRGESAATLSKMLYAENDLIAGEGGDGNTRGMAATIQDYQDWIDSLGPGGTKGCKYTVIDPVVASATTFSSFLTLHCKANPPVMPQDKDWRLMYVWKRYPAGWRVVLEMYVSGKM